MNTQTNISAPNKQNKSISSMFVRRNYLKAKYNLFQKYFSKEPKEHLKPIFDDYLEAAKTRESLGNFNKAAKLLMKGIKKYAYLQVDAAVSKERLPPETTSFAASLAEKCAGKGSYYTAINLLSQIYLYAKKADKEILSVMIINYTIPYVKGITKDPTNASAFVTAEKAIEKAAELAPHRKDELHNTMADAYLERAKHYTKDPVYDNGFSIAERAIDKAVEYAPDRVNEFYDVIANAYLKRAEHYVEDPSYDNGFSIAERAIGKAFGYDPDRKNKYCDTMANAYLERAKHYTKDPVYDNGFSIAERAIAKAVDYNSGEKDKYLNFMANAYIKRANHYSRDKTWSTGLSIAKRAIEKAKHYSSTEDIDAKIEAFVSEGSLISA